MVLKAAPMTVKPVFELMTQKDILVFYHFQMPRWLFFDVRYKTLSIESKVVYSFLLNRFQLSRLNNWINQDGEVFIIYTREDLSGEIGISYKKVISCVKELAEASLIWERRCGRGDANQIYLARVELNEEEALLHRSTPFATAEDECAGSRPAEMAGLDSCGDGELPVGEDTVDDTKVANSEAVEECSNRESGIEKSFLQGTATNQDLPVLQVKDCQNGASRTAEMACPDLQKPHPNYIYSNNTNSRDIKCSQSVRHTRARDGTDGPADDIEGLERVLEGCDLWTLSPETAKVFENAIERLWFTTSYRIGGAILPQKKVRSHLYELDNIRLQEAERKIAANTDRVIKNTTAYVMAVIFNTIWEVESDVIADPYLNSLRLDKGGDDP